MRSQCDEDEELDEDLDDECPPCGGSGSGIADYARLIAACAPIVLACLKYGPPAVDWVRGLVAQKPAKKPTKRGSPQ
jgi:hypothetical protein